MKTKLIGVLLSLAFTTEMVRAQNTAPVLVNH
jgi:hypothetical protein